jgi:hypothetical protein
VSQCDVVTVNAPLHAGTRGLVNADLLKHFKKGAWLVNTARGAICDADDVAAALKSGQLAGYSGDVWNVQPAPREHPWRTMKNPLGGGNGMVPHYSGTTLDAQARYASGTKSIIQNYLEGKDQEPANIIVGKQGYESKACECLPRVSPRFCFGTDVCAQTASARSELSAASKLECAVSSSLLLKPTKRIRGCCTVYAGVQCTIICDHKMNLSLSVTRPVFAVARVSRKFYVTSWLPGSRHNSLLALRPRSRLPPCATTSAPHRDSPYGNLCSLALAMECRARQSSRGYACVP